MSATAMMDLAQRRLQQLNSVRPYIRPELFQQQPVSGIAFLQQSAPYVDMTTVVPGAAATTVVSFTVPRGQQAKVSALAIVYVGGGFVDGSGNLVWRVLINGAAHKGLGNLQAQIGSMQQPNPIQILLTELDIVTVTVEIPAGKPLLPGLSGACLQGYTMPIAKGV